MFLLVERQPLLASHIQGKYDRSGKTLFEDENTWFALSDIFAKMLQDPSSRKVYLIVDNLTNV